MDTGSSALPVELIIRILSFLPFKDIIICSGVSRQFREIIDTSSTLEYILELGLCGLLDPVHGNLTIPERLHRLRKREEAWSNLTWHSECKIPVGQKYIFWELCDDLFVGTYKKPSDSLPTARVFDMIDIFELQSRPTSGRTRTLALEKLFCNLSIDPGQNLLVLVEEPLQMPKFWRMHIRTISNGMPHARATQPTINITVAHDTWPIDNSSPGAIDTQILGCVILYSQRRGPGLSGSISVVDWTTGAEMFVSYPALGDWCCTLLSETELLVAERTYFRSQPCLELYDLRGSDKWKTPYVTFQLPFQNCETIWRPVYSYAPVSCSDTGESPAKANICPFKYPPAPRLLAFRFKLTATVKPINLDIFLLPDRLRRYINPGDVVPWEVWGPQATRILREVLPKTWRRNIQGYRAVLPHINTVLDFNSNLWAAGDPGVVTQSSQITLISSRGFNIVSSLPYRELRPIRPFGYKHVLLGDNIVCIDNDADDDGLIKTLHVLEF